jgi:hypothetical protein
MTDDELNMMQEIIKSAGIVRDLKIGHDRYETVRLLNPRQFAEIYEKNIKTGIPFDTLVDQMPTVELTCLHATHRQGWLYLLPCPFCGGKAKLCTDGLTTIVCCDCGINVSNYERSISKLKDQWNKRITQS